MNKEHHMSARALQRLTTMPGMGCSVSQIVRTGVASQNWRPRALGFTKQCRFLTTDAKAAKNKQERTWSAIVTPLSRRSTNDWTNFFEPVHARQHDRQPRQHEEMKYSMESQCSIGQHPRRGTQGHAHIRKEEAAALTKAATEGRHAHARCTRNKIYVSRVSSAWCAEFTDKNRKSTRIHRTGFDGTRARH